MVVESSVGEQVVVEVLVEATPETIFPFFTDPEKMTRWKGMSAALDPRPGGEYRCQVTPRSLALGEYLEVDPPKRVVFTFGWETEEGVPPGSSTVEITLEPQGASTLVRLIHGGLGDEHREQHAVGWVHFFERLAVAAAGGDPGPDPWAQPDATPPG